MLRGDFDHKNASETIYQADFFRYKFQKINKVNFDDTGCPLKYDKFTFRMNNEHPKTVRQKVYLQALVRISKIHDEIASGSFPGVKLLAEKIGVNERTVKRDLDVLRNQLKSPIVYERRKKGFRYAEIGWTFPLANLDEKTCSPSLSRKTRLN